MYIFGQILGLAATAASFIIPFFKTKRTMLYDTILINVLTAMNLIFIGRIGSALCLYGVACVQATVSLLHDAKQTEPSRAEKLIFLVLYLTFGFLGYFTAPDFIWAWSTQNLIELLPICGSVFNMLFVCTRDEQKARVMLLLTAGIWAVYTALIGSTTFFAQLISIVTTCIAIVKYRKSKTKPTKQL